MTDDTRSKDTARPFEFGTADGRTIELHQEQGRYRIIETIAGRRHVIPMGAFIENRKNVALQLRSETVAALFGTAVRALQRLLRARRLAPLERRGPSTPRRLRA